MKFFKEYSEKQDKYGKYGSFDFSEYREKSEEFLTGFDFKLSPVKPMKSYRISSDNRNRLMIGFFVVLLFICFLIFRMGYWQIYKADDLKEKAAQMQTADTELDALRGCIYDSRMNTLAETITEYELYAYSYDIYKNENLTGAEKDATVKRFAEVTGEDEEVIARRLNGKDNLVKIADGLSQDAVDAAAKTWGSSVYAKTKVARNYPNGAFAAQLLGGVNNDNQGRTGLEYEYNSVLAGIKGRTVKTTDSRGNTLANGSSKLYQAQDGYNIVTTIDSVLQHYVEDALETGMRKTGAESISCIVMSPKTGEVLAMSQLPEYDPNDSMRPSDPEIYKEFKKLSDKEQSDYLSRMWTIEQISSVYEPGSTFKLIAAASSLEMGKSTLNSTYSCNGAITVNDTSLHCLGHHGSQTLKTAVGNSCNCALARVALNMGADNFYNYIELFGFRDRTGIDLPGETNSIVKNSEGLSKVDLATTGYGQGIAVTPIQVLCAVNSFGNGGVLMKPHIVSKIIDNDGNTVEEIKNREIRQVVSEETAEQMKEVMEYYVSDAGGDKAYVPGFRIGGKTGTANIASEGGYSEKTDCSFVAMAPMDDPQISMLVIVHKPTKTQYGNASAGPIIKSIMEKSLMYLGVEREYSEKEAVAARKGKATVPDVTGMSSEKAVEIIKTSKLKYVFVPEDSGDKPFVVQDQYPKAGEKIEKKSIVYLYSE